MADFLPRAETLLAAWAANFSALVAARPGAYGLMDSDAATIATVSTMFKAALTRAMNPATRTRPAVADKNAKKMAMLGTLRPYAQVIKSNPGVSNDAKIGLGLAIDTGRSPIPAPTSVPVLMITPGAPLHHWVRFADSNSPDRQAKPRGVQGVMLSVSVGDMPPADPAGVAMLGFMTRQFFDVEFRPADRRKTAFYYGRYYTATGLMGPWSAPVERGVV